MTQKLYSNITIAVDNGNSYVKAVYDNLANHFMFPNVVLPTETERSVILNQGNPLSLLDVEIVSPAIPNELGRRFHIGQLAAKNEKANRVTGLKASQMKSKRPETVITILTTIAYAVAEKFKQDIAKGTTEFKADVHLGTGLPINEISEASNFITKLTTGVHTVKFLTTPVFGGVTVQINISMPDGVSVDDVSGVIDMATDDGSSLVQKSFGVADIGGVDMDIAFFSPELVLDDTTSTGYRVNLNESITQIREEFNKSKGLEYIKSDSDVVRMLVNKQYEVKHTGLVVGSIQDIANRLLSELATDILGKVLSSWEKFSDAEEFYFIGGGAIVLAPYIKEAEKQGRPLRFDTSENSQLRNLRGTFKMLQQAVKNSEAAAALGDE